MQMMSEAETIAILEEQFQGASGFIARLQSGEGLDSEGVQRAQDAIMTLGELWVGRAEVPKAALLPLVDVYTPISESASLYPGKENEIERLAMDMESQVEGLASLWPQTKRLSMTEEEASAIVYGHMTGLSGLALMLHHREPLYIGWDEELRAALDTLTVAWASRDTVPRVIACPMLEIRSLIRGHAGNYPKQEQKLIEIADDLAEHVRRCLQGKSGTQHQLPLVDNL